MKVGVARLLLLSALFAGIPVRIQIQAQSVQAELPGKGLAQHDFMYAGESHERNIYIVRGGKIVWHYSDPAGKGEISDAVMLSNGNVLFTHQVGVTEISPEKKVLWNYDAPAGHEVHTAVPIGNDRVLYIQNGDPALLRVVNIVTGATEKEIPLKTKQPSSTHGQFRHARLTQQGTLLVAHMDLNKVVEYDASGNELWSFPADRPWGVTPLDGNNVLITDSKGVREITRRGETVWNWTPADAPGYTFASLQQAWRLPNGNTVINNWVNEWNSPGKDLAGALQAIEVTPAKQVVWVLDSWTEPARLGPATTIQFLDQPVAAEDVHFGEFR
jgi:outer membrane lipoprotein-sorting protein